MTAIIQFQGKQYKVEKNQTLTVDRLENKPGEKITVSDVLLVDTGKKVSVGTPTVTGAKVVLEVGDHTRGDKVRVAKFKSKSRYRKVRGHRQLQTMLTVTSITAGK